MNTAPAVGSLVMELTPEFDYAPSWFVQTARGKISIPNTRGITTSVEALELALRDNWSFLAFRDMTAFVIKHVPLITVSFVREGDRWVHYPKTAFKGGVPDSATESEIRDYFVGNGWNVTDRPLVFERLDCTSGGKTRERSLM